MDYELIKAPIIAEFALFQQFLDSAFSAEEQKIIEEQLETTNEIIKSFCFAGLARTMNQFNKKGNGKTE